MGPKESRGLNILTQAEIDAFSAIPTLSDAEKDHYFHLNDEDSSVFTGRESPETKAVFILFFGYFKFRLPYLTMVEGLKLCAQTFTKDVKQLSCCAG